MSKLKKRTILTIAVLFSMIFTFIIFAPCEIVATNSSSFRIGVTDIVWSLVLCAFCVMVVAVGFSVILPEKIWKIYILLCCAFTVSAYAQTMFFNKQMESLLGQDISFGIGTIVVNICIWLAIFVGLFLIGYKVKAWEKFIGAIALVICAVQMLAFVSLFFNTESREEFTSMLTDKGTFELSKDEHNVIVFILDTVDGRVVDEILTTQPDYLEDYDGFTYYPNCTSVYSRTYPSIPYLLTNQNCEFDIPDDEWIQQAYEKGDFLDSMYNAGVNIGLYTNSQYVADEIGDKVYNYYQGEQRLSFKSVIKQSAKMVLYRDMPYILKKYFEYNPAEVEKKILRLDDEAHANDDQWYEDRLEDASLTLDIDNPTFRFYHLAAYHNGWDVNNAIKAFEVTKAYITQMKELGIYDDATIIIMADHGFSGGGDTLDLPQKTNVPLMLVKLAGDSGESCKISDVPVSQTEFEPTVLKAYGIECDRPSFEEIESSDRTRFFYYSALYSDEEGEVELREYRVNGDAGLPESYEFTGNVRDIKYSENKVSHR